MSQAAGYSASYFRHRIEDHFAEAELEVVCRKHRHTYAVYWADDDTPLAKIERIGQGDEVRLWWWDEGCWRRAGESAAPLCLDKALEYITDDPDRLFFSYDETDDDDTQPVPDNPVITHLALFMALKPSVVEWTTFAAAVGGLAGGPWLGPVWGMLVAVLGLSVPELLRGRWQAALASVIAVGMPIGLLAAPGAVIGSGVHQAWSENAWGWVAGALAGASGGLLILARPWIGWLLGAAMGIVLARPLVAAAHLQDHFWGLLLIVIVAAGCARVYSALVRACRSCRESLQRVVDRELSIQERRTS